MIAFLLALLLSLPPYRIIGPGALAPADPGVLERVAARRLNAGWGLEGPLEGVLVGVADCSQLGKHGWLLTEAGQLAGVTVVDCSQARHRQAMIDNGILADVSEPGLRGMAWLVVR